MEDFASVDDPTTPTHGVVARQDYVSPLDGDDDGVREVFSEQGQRQGQCGGCGGKQIPWLVFLILFLLLALVYFCYGR